MAHEEFEPVDTTGNLQAIEVLGVEPMHQLVLVRLRAGPVAGPPGPSLGTWSIPLDVARDLVADLLVELRELEEAPPRPTQ